MSATLALALVGLGLLDSTSFGTLLIPIWLLLTPGRVRTGRIALYLATVAVFYFCVGVLLVLGADAALRAVQKAVANIAPTHLLIGQLVLGLIVIVASYRLEARVRRRSGEPGRMQRWKSSPWCPTWPPWACSRTPISPGRSPAGPWSATAS